MKTLEVRRISLHSYMLTCTDNTVTAGIWIEDDNELNEMIRKLTEARDKKEADDAE